MLKVKFEQIGNSGSGKCNLEFSDNKSIKLGIKSMFIIE